MKTQTTSILLSSILGMSLLGLAWKEGSASKSESSLAASAKTEEPKSLVIHDVADFKKWNAVYNEVYNLRKEAGETSSYVGFPKDKPKNVHVLNAWQSSEARKAHFSNPKVKEVMTKAGVIGAPRIVDLNFDGGANTLADKAPLTVLIYYKVKEYHIWKAGFMATGKERAAAGELGFEAGTFSDDHEMAYVLSQWKSEAEFKAYFAESGYKSKRNNTVLSQPTAVIFQ